MLASYLVSDKVWIRFSPPDRLVSSYCIYFVIEFSFFIFFFLIYFFN